MPNIVCGNFTFVSDFDSSNIAHAEEVPRKEPGNDGIDYEFNVWTHPDCAGTEFENNNRSWFYFGITGGLPFITVKLNIVNLNRQCKMYSQGMAPVTRTVPGKLQWERIRDRPTFSLENNIFTISWKYRTLENLRAVTYFAFTYPYSYTDLQASLRSIDIQFLKASGPKLKKVKKLGSKKSDVLRKMEKKEKIQRHRLDDIYYKRECICFTSEERRVDLITISSFHGMTMQREPRFSGLFPEKDVDRPFQFVGKKVIFFSARVHPGETPSSFVMNGVIQLLLNRDDPIAITLRRLYVFKLIPMLNPDGVSRGHYRTDTRGINLNRFYINPSLYYQPSVYAARAVVLYHCNGCETMDQTSNNKENPSETPIVQSKSEDCFLSLAKENSTDSSMDQNSTFSESPSLKSENVPVKSNEPSCSGAVDVKDENVTLETDANLKSSSQLPDKSHIGNDLVRKEAESFESQAEKIAGDSENLQDKICKDQGTEQNIIDALNELKCKEVLSEKNEEGGAVSNDSDSMNQSCDEKLVLSDSQDVICKNNESDKGKKIKEFLTPTQNSLAPFVLSSISHDSLLTSKLFTKKVPPTASTKPRCDSSESGLFLYIDFHGHASKKGIFMYGNHFKSIVDQVECMLLPKLMSINSQNFHFNACNFSERNMYLRDRRDGLSREGSGRVAVWKATGLLKSYTLECNYNTGRIVNNLPPPLRSHEKRSHNFLVPPKYTPQTFEEIGRALGASILDLTGSNPNSRLVNSEYYSLNGVRDSLKLQQIAENNLSALQRNIVNKQFKKLSGTQQAKSVHGASNSENVFFGSCPSKAPASVEQKQAAKAVNPSIKKKENMIVNLGQQNKKVRPKSAKMSNVLQVRAKGSAISAVNAVPCSSKSVLSKPRISKEIDNVIVKKGPKRIKISEDSKVKWGKIIASTSKRKEPKVEEGVPSLWKNPSRLEKKSTGDSSRRLFTLEKRRKKSKSK